MSTLALFIGGPVDGRRMVLPRAYPSWEVPARPEPSTAGPSDTAAVDPAMVIERHVYHLVQTSCHADQALGLYVHVDDSSWLARLLGENK